MNKKPIESARDADLRSSYAALLRASRRAHELAAQTGTDIVISENGQVKRIRPDSQLIEDGVSEPKTDYKP